MNQNPCENIAGDSHQRLILAAAEVFMEQGYRGSIDSIAVRAGVARQTIYNHFSSKDDLFSEVANLAAADIMINLDSDGENLRERLLHFGTALRQCFYCDKGMAMYRALASEVPRFPALAKAFFAKGPEQLILRLTTFLSQAMDDGELRRDDPRFVAELLLSMLDCFDRTRRVFGVADYPLENEEARVTHIIDVFLRAYTPAH